MSLGVMQHNVAGAHDVFQGIQKSAAEQERVEHGVVELQVVDAFHLCSDGSKLNTSFEN